MKAIFGPDALSGVSVLWNCMIGLIQEGFLGSGEVSD